MGKHEARPSPAQKKRRIARRLVPLLLLLLLLLLALCLLLRRPPEAAVPGAAPSPSPGPGPVTADTNSIAIPGYEGLSLEAGKKQQSLALPNPARNHCIMVITLRLEDGTELWRSGDIRPGESSDNICLSQPLEAGTYPNAELVYDCFTPDEARSPLNRAITKLTLQIKQQEGISP